MEQKLQIQWQKFGPDHGKCRKTQTAFEQLHSGKKYFCRIAQSLPDHICEGFGWLSAEDQTATCLPARAVLTIVPVG